MQTQSSVNKFNFRHDQNRLPGFTLQRPKKIDVKEQVRKEKVKKELLERARHLPTPQTTYRAATKPALTKGAWKAPQDAELDTVLDALDHYYDRRPVPKSILKVGLPIVIIPTENTKPVSVNTHRPVPDSRKADGPNTQDETDPTEIENVRLKQRVESLEAIVNMVLKTIPSLSPTHSKPTKTQSMASVEPPRPEINYFSDFDDTKWVGTRPVERVRSVGVVDEGDDALRTLARIKGALKVTPESMSEMMHILETSLSGFHKVLDRLESTFL